MYNSVTSFRCERSFGECAAESAELSLESSGDNILQELITKNKDLIENITKSAHGAVVWNADKTGVAEHLGKDSQNPNKNGEKDNEGSLASDNIFPYLLGEMNNNI